MALDLGGRIALVTGASRGIGRGCALALAEAGAAVAVNYVRDRTAAEDVARRVQSLGGRSVVAHADVSDRTQVARLFDEVESGLGPVDIVVANAGSSIRRSCLESSEEDLRRTLDVLVFGAFHTLQEASARMLRAGRRGHLVVIGSVHAWVPFPNALSYNVGKAALHHLARTFAAELTHAGIAVNVVVPGLTDTPGERNFRTEQQLQEVGHRLPLGRMGTADEVGRLVRFLVSPDNTYMTGSVVTADGGLSVTMDLGLRPAPNG